MHYDPYGRVIRQDPEGSLPSPVPPFTSALPALRGPLRAWAWARDNFSKQHVPWPFCSRLRLVLLPRPSLPRGRAGRGRETSQAVARDRVQAAPHMPTDGGWGISLPACPFTALPRAVRPDPFVARARSFATTSQGTAVFHHALKATDWSTIATRAVDS